MSLFSFLRKNKQESPSDDSAFYSRAEEDSKAVRSRSRRKAGQNSKSDDPVDPVLPEKKRARRRLIGAVALVLAAVIGLPMVLDSEPQPLADDIAIQIPSKDKPVSGNIARPAAPSVARIAASSSLDPKEEMMESPPAATAGNTDKLPSSTALAPSLKASVESKEESKPAVEPAKMAKATEKPTVQVPKPDTKPVDKVDDAVRAKALLEGKADPKALEKKSGKFVIQVAALATKEKVDELQTKLKGAGMKSYTQKVATESGDRTRIRVGPFGSKDEAEKARAKILKLGLNGTLVPA